MDTCAIGGETLSLGSSLVSCIVFLYLCTAQILDLVQRYIYKHDKQLGSTKTKQASHILQYITHLHQHTWSITPTYMYVSKMCIQNIANMDF